MMRDDSAMVAGEVRRLIAQGEGQLVEFKSGLGEEREAIEALCGFLNADGGHLLIGVRDDRHVVGVTIGSNSIERLAEKISRTIDPQPYPSIETVQLGEKEVIVIGVESRKQGIVHLGDGRAWVRVGRTTRRLSAQEIRTRHIEGANQAPSPDAEREAKVSGAIQRLEAVRIGTSNLAECFRVACDDMSNGLHPAMFDRTVTGYFAEAEREPGKYLSDLVVFGLLRSERVPGNAVASSGTASLHDLPHDRYILTELGAAVLLKLRDLYGTSV